LEEGRASHRVPQAFDFRLVHRISPELATGVSRPFLV
jgi:hypothetical protein